MKKTFTLLFSICFLTVWGQTTTTFEDISLEQDSFYNGSDLSGGFTSGNLFFPNSYNTMFDSWSGWAVSNTTDVTTPGRPNQYSSITGGGVNGSNNYAVTFISGTSIIVPQNEAAGGTFDSMYVTNSTYLFFSLKDGDQFAKKFGGEDGNDPDFFFLTIKKYLDGQLSEDSIDFYLADYRFADNSQDYIVTEWTGIDLKPLGDADSLVFSLSSSDVGMFGMNTPAYFCLDNITTLDVMTPVAEVDDLSSWNVYPNPTRDWLRIENINNQSSAIFQLYAANGQLLLQDNLIDATQEINLSDFTPGIYFGQIIHDGGIEKTTIIKQ